MLLLQITAKLIKEMASSDWKERRGAIAEVNEMLLKAGKRIEPNTGELFSALKLRLADKNQATQCDAISTHLHKSAKPMAETIHPPPYLDRTIARYFAACLDNYADIDELHKALMLMPSSSTGGMMDDGHHPRTPL